MYRQRAVCYRDFCAIACVRILVYMYVQMQRKLQQWIRAKIYL